MDKPDNRRYSSAHSSALVKIGGLWKRAQCLRRFSKPNYRYRVFILTNTAISYYAGTLDRIGGCKGRISLDSIRAIEYVESSAFMLAHTFQIIYQTKKHGFVTLYVTASDKNECINWVETIRQACYFNQDMLMHYHPGGFIKSTWSCCNQRTRHALGCQPTYYLLTRSSSRYADMRRRDHTPSILQSRRRSQPLARSTDVPRKSKNRHLARNGDYRSNSCDNIVEHAYTSQSNMLPFSNMGATSCYTIATASDDVQTDDDIDTPMDEVHVTFDIPDLERNSRHQVAPNSGLAAPFMTPFPDKEDTPNGDGDVTPTITSSTLLIGSCNSSESTLSHDHDINYIEVSRNRKRSLEPRISETDPEMIHV